MQNRGRSLEQKRRIHEDRTGREETTGSGEGSSVSNLGQIELKHCSRWRSHPEAGSLCPRLPTMKR